MFNIAIIINVSLVEVVAKGEAPQYGLLVPLRLQPQVGDARRLRLARPEDCGDLGGRRQTRVPGRLRLR